VPLKLVGLAVCFLLLSFDIAKDNRIVRNLCSLIRPGGCELVMTSRASRIFNLTWSEIGFFYFSATTLFLFAPLPLEVKRVFLGVISFGTLPFSIFSLYYQGRILKTWCALCVLIQILLLLEVLFGSLDLLSSGIIIQSARAGALISLCVAFTLPPALWNLMKSPAKRLLNSVPYQRAYNRLIKNREVFEALLRAQPIAPPGWSDIGITIGNPLATNTIIKVCNTHCTHCANAHLVLRRIVDKNS